jgi:hypothetical protein
MKWKEPDMIERYERAKRQPERPAMTNQDKVEQEDWATRKAADTLVDVLFFSEVESVEAHTAVAAALRERDEFAERRAYERGRKDMLNEARGAIGALSVAGEEKVTWTKTR